MTLDGVFALLVLGASGWLLTLLLRLLSRQLTEEERRGRSGSDGGADEPQARGGALRLMLCAWVFWAPTLLWAGSVRTIVVGLIAGLIASHAAVRVLAAKRFGLTAGFWLAQSLVQGAALLMVGGLVAESRLDPERLAELSTTVSVRAIGQAWSSWQESLVKPVGDETGGRAEVGGGESRAMEVQAALLAAHRLGLAVPLATQSPAPVIEVAAYPELDREQVVARLVPRFAASLALLDAWGRPLELRGRLEPQSEDLPGFLVRSAGRDGRFDPIYRLGAPAPESDDLVWADGVLVQGPHQPDGSGLVPAADVLPGGAHR